MRVSSRTFWLLLNLQIHSFLWWFLHPMVLECL